MAELAGLLEAGLNLRVEARLGDTAQGLRIVETVEAAVLQALPERLGEAFLTKLADVSIKELNAIFTDVRGVDLQAALRGLRVDEVGRRLEADPGLSAEAAARQCGFGYYPLLQRLFRARFGARINEFRGSR